MLWLVFSLVAGFAHAAGATELDIDYLRGSTAPSELTTTFRCPRCPRESCRARLLLGATRRRESCEVATTRRGSTPGLQPRDWHPSIVLDPDIRQKPWLD
jgi:hypothetical protein